MPGTFTVVGTLPLPGRGLVAYGHLVTGDVRVGEHLAIPLNSSIAMSVVIRSIGAVDGTAAGSHMALLLNEDENGIDLLGGLDLEGETLAVSPGDLAPHASSTSVDEAKRRLRDLLVRLRWPSAVAWVDESHIIIFRKRVFVFLRNGVFEPEYAIRAKYE